MGFCCGDLVEHEDLLEEMMRKHEVFSPRAATRLFAGRCTSGVGRSYLWQKVRDWIESQPVFRKARLPARVTADESLEAATEKASRKLKLKSLKCLTLQYFNSGKTVARRGCARQR